MSSRPSAVLATLTTLVLWLGLPAPLQPAEELVLEEDWDSLSIDPETWEPWGDPQPVVLPSVHGREGVLDNRGDSVYCSGVQSKLLPAMPGGFVIESDVYLEVTDLAGCWILTILGISRTTGERYEDGYYLTGIEHVLSFEGGACWATPVEFQRHSYVFCVVNEKAQPGLFDYNADAYNNGWHTLSIQVDAERIVSFYVDGSFLYTWPEPVDPVVLEDPQSIVLGGRSSGFGGKAYHDTVRVFALKDSPARFRRGDTDASGTVNITDAILTLNHLFLGGPTPGCADAADADDDGALQITDAIYLLGGLFLGGPQPPAPGANACGPDPTEDALDCASYAVCP